MPVHSVAEGRPQIVLLTGLVTQLQTGAARLDGGFRQAELVGFVDDESETTEQASKPLVDFIAVFDFDVDVLLFHLATNMQRNLGKSNPSFSTGLATTMR